MSRRAGKFITFEGPEGGGKTTQAKRLLARLTAEGHEVIYTREPGGTPTGEAIREILQYDKAGEPLCDETEVFLFAASRAQLVRNVIIPALERGTHVICDRFADSTTVYQGYGRGFEVEQMIAINQFAINGATPDLTLLMDVEVATGFERIASRQRELFQKSDRIENEAREFHERVRRGYLELAGRYPERFRKIDAARDPAEVEADVWHWVQRVLA
ncbi:MAG TPA: dTMP kinase [Kiritimatiellia bacterium]|nr:dTMP kinase [Kiritimatiellia bacterium]HMO97949.1 dTMP kinase [Kiritimatiellia bacterium]HMP95300.1 dTMP kinase [Kiritimatiellia bacterium]